MHEPDQNEQELQGLRLRATEAKSRLILEKAYEAFIEIDQLGKITDWNAQAESMFGWTREEVMGRPLADTIIPPRYREAHKRGIARFIKTGEGPILNKRIEVEALHRDGHEFPVELAVTPLELVEGSVGFFAFVRDVSERKRAEKEVADARDQAVEASRLKSQFLANMSHEIRTPLNAVIGMLDLLTRTPLTPEQQELAAVAFTSAESLLEIINDILDFSRIEAGKLRLETQDFDLIQTVEGTAELLAEEARKKGLLLLTHVAPDVPHIVQGDSGRLRQVLLNLAGNAIKFTEKGEVLIAVAREGRDRLRFVVKDTGIGISANLVEMLFQPFTQADGSIIRRYGGTGLGLSISKRLVEMMGGDIHVETQPASGSVFSFVLPMRASSRQPEPPGALSELRNIRVLIVDGPEASSDILCSYATAWGMQCTLAESGEAGLDLMSQRASAAQPFHLAIVDSLISDMDPLDLAKAVRKRQFLRNTRLILITAFADDRLAERALSVGFDACLSRPVKQSRLMDCIVQVLTQQPSAQQEDESRAPFKAEESPTGPILIAEDNTANQKMLSLMVRKMGLASHCVANGREAVDAAVRIRYAIILMDCQMPEMDGYEATRAIRKAETLTGHHVPIIGVTAHAMKGDREKCLECGMDDYLSKPITFEALSTTIQNWLRESGPARPSAPLLPGTGTAAEARQKSAEPPLSIEQLKALCSPEESLTDLLEPLQASIPVLLQRVSEAIRARDLESAQRTSHELRSCCTNYTLNRMARLSQAIEQAVAAQNWDGAGLHSEALKLAFEQVRSFLASQGLAPGN